MTTDLVVLDGKEIARPQPGGIGHQNPRRQQDAVFAGPRSALHVSGGMHPMGDLGVIQGYWVRRRHLDPSQRTEYTSVHVSLLCGESHEGAEHSAVVVDRGGSPMTQRIVQIGVDLVRRKVGSLPGQPADQDGELFQVAGGASDTAAVGLCEIQNRHLRTPRRGATYPECRTLSIPTEKGHTVAKGQLAQLYRSPVFLILQSAARAASDWMLRATYLGLLAVALWCHRTELVLGLLVVGQFAQALTEAVRPRTG